MFSFLVLDAGNDATTPEGRFRTPTLRTVEIVLPPRDAAVLARGAMLI
jgi:hypothetical protein